MAANVKLYFQIVPNEIVVRKVALPINNEPDFKHLLVKIHELNGEELREFKVQYIDQDGDTITIETDEEFQVALKDQGQEPYKFTITEKRRMQLVSPAFSEDHGKHVCISCHAILTGFRYKCVTCPNYDICQRCESNCIHPAHDMLRIASPTKVYPPHFFSRLQRLYEKVFNPQNFHSTGYQSKSPTLEPIARDLVSDDEASAIIPPTDHEASLPSIKELTQNVQCLIDKDLEEGEEEVFNEIEENVINLDFKPIRADDEASLPAKPTENENTNQVLIAEEQSQKEGSIATDEDHEKASKKLPQERSSTLSKLQEEIDKLLAPLTPPNKSESVTPQNEIIEAETKEGNQITIDNEEHSDSSCGSSVSSSPFELCEIEVQHSTTAIIEPNPEHKILSLVKPSIADHNVQKESRSASNCDEEITQVAEPEIVQVDNAHDEIDVIEAGALLKIVEEQEVMERDSKAAGIDNYMLASSRILLRKQLRSQTSEAARNSFNVDNYSTRSRSMNYTSDTYEYRPAPYAHLLEAQRSYSSRPNYYSQYYGSSSSTVTEAVGQMVSMGFTDEDGWLTQLCALKKGNIEQVLDVLMPVKK